VVPTTIKTTVHCAVSPASGIEDISRATVATQGPVSPLSRGQMLNIGGGGDFSISIVAGLYTIVVDSTSFWVLRYGAVTALPVSGNPEIDSVPFPPAGAVNLYAPHDVDLHLRLFKNVAGVAYIARQQ
jgi:hypothetical protein